MSGGRAWTPAGLGENLPAPGIDAQLEQLRDVTVWKKGDQRAPHKPLLLLLALARVASGAPRLMPFAEVEPRLRGLLVDFGPGRASYHPEMPFWRLQNDGAFWQVPERAAALALAAHRKRTGDVPARLLIESHASGGFSPELYARLAADPALVRRIASDLLFENFPESLHEPILDAVGMPWVPMVSPARRRDPAFRDAVLRIYSYRCAICGFDGRLGFADLGLEAAHVRWHAHGGPDVLENGVALCSFHHRMLDRGAIGIGEDLRVLVSEHVNGGPQVDQWLLAYAGAALSGPQRGHPRLAPHFLRWHQREVFKGPARQVDLAR